MSEGRINVVGISDVGSVEIPLEDRGCNSNGSSRKSSTSTSSFEDVNAASKLPDVGTPRNSSRRSSVASIVSSKSALSRKSATAKDATTAGVDETPDVYIVSVSASMASVTPKGALSFKTTSVDDPHFYAQSKTSTKHQAPSKPYRAANEDRDPEHVNDAVKIRFEDIFAEPEGTYSFGTIWGASFKLFTDSKVWCYKFLSALCGVPCGIFWGCHFACLSFCQIWWCEPSLRSISILMRPCARLCGIFLKSFVEPLHYAVGKVFSSIRLTMTKE